MSLGGWKGAEARACWAGVWGAGIRKVFKGRGRRGKPADQKRNVATAKNRRTKSEVPGKGRQGKAAEDQSNVPFFGLVSEGAPSRQRMAVSVRPPFCCGWNWHQERPFRNSPAPGLAPHESSSFWVASRERTLIGAYASKVIGGLGLERKGVRREVPPEIRPTFQCPPRVFVNRAAGSNVSRQR